MAGTPSRAAQALRLLRKGQLDRAQQMLVKLYAESPEDLGCLVGLARLQMARARYQEARSFLEPLLQQVPEHAEAQSHLALIDFLGGNAQGLDALKKLLANKKAGFFECFNAAVAFLNKGDDPSALAALQKARVADQKNPQVRVLLGQLHLKRRELRDAIGQFQKAVELSNNELLPVLLLSAAHAANGEAALGAEAVNKALQAQPLSPQLHERMIELSLLAGWPQRAIASAMALRQVDKANPEYAYMHALAMLASGLVPEARHILQETLKKVPKSATVRVALAQTLRLMGEEPEAMALLEQAHHDHPEHPGVACELAAALLHAPDGGPKAQRALKKAMDAEPTHPVLHYYLALVQARAGDKVAAKASAMKAQVVSDPVLRERADALIKALSP